MNLPTPSFALIGYVAAATCVLGVWAGWHFGSAHWQTQYNALSAANWQAKYEAEHISRTAIQSQLETAHTTISRNTGVINDYSQRLAQTTADRDRFRAALGRLQSEAARSSAGAGAVSAPDSGFAAVNPGAQDELAECRALLIDAWAEGTANADQLDALIWEIKPQL